MAKKYLKNENGIVKAVTSDNLQLEKPLLNENYDIEVHNRNMDKIDNAIQEVKGKIDGLELVASNVKMADGSTAEEAINLNKNKISNLQDEVLVNKSNILTSTELASQALNKANEAFQRGDNVKKQLVDKLISEGLDVSTNDTFEYLINNIALGKKWATGVYPRPAGGNGFHSIRGMSFKPSYFIAIQPISANNYSIYIVTPITGSKCYRADTGDSAYVSDCYVYDDGYAIKMLYSNYGDTDWIAFE